MYQIAHKLQNYKWNDQEAHLVLKKICQSYLVALNTLSLLEDSEQWMAITPRELKDVMPELT
jgi:hypothetical protein